ncbi:hypothetical protein F4823DRAFT_214895 [Ustulina deusta]|nr:hypothetical protein F4823DRAFT_214895 [Ustulina deusta]
MVRCQVTCCRFGAVWVVSGGGFGLFPSLIETSGTWQLVTDSTYFGICYSVDENVAFANRQTCTTISISRSPIKTHSVYLFSGGAMTADLGTLSPYGKKLFSNELRSAGALFHPHQV